MAGRGGTTGREHGQRAALRARLRAEAAAVAVPERCDVCVVGGGAAGLVAAIVAAEAGASVVVLEAADECGRSILATGNGRCNLANTHLSPARYNRPTFVAETCGGSDAWLGDVLSFFADCGLRWCEEDGRLYPLSRQAASVRNVLLARARRAGAVLAAAREVTRVDETDAGYVVAYGASLGAAAHAGGSGTRHGSRADAAGARGRNGRPEQGGCTDAAMLGGLRGMLTAEALVVATGGQATSALEGLGVELVARQPVLCPVACTCEALNLSMLDGRRAHALVSLVGRDGQPRWQERGEVLFRGYGISGIVAFDLSRRVSPGDRVELDLVPDVAARELNALASRGDNAGLDGVLDPAIAAALRAATRPRHHNEARWEQGAANTPADAARAQSATPANEGLVAAARLAKALPLRVTGLTEISRAQICRGGLATGQFEPATLVCQGHPQLFACGEALDVDADCGGFNLAWAWKSGMVAGRAAARRRR